MVKNSADIWKILSGIPDPDIPVVSITDLGLVEGVKFHDNKATVRIRPSYSGCPAMDLFKTEIISELQKNGITHVDVQTVFTPPWTTDLIIPEAREKMKRHGIAPPEDSEDTEHFFQKHAKPVTCPWCNGQHTKRTSQFGSTPCKALWFCDDCNQPFEYFKCLK